MTLTRRGFGKLAAAGAPWLCGFCDLGNRSKALAQAFAPRINSVINGVQMGLQPFCYHDLPMTVQNRPTLIQRMVQNGLGAWNFTPSGWSLGLQTLALPSRRLVRDCGTGGSQQALNTMAG